MARIWWMPLLCATLLCAQQQQQSDKQQLKTRDQKAAEQKSSDQKYQEPPEEDDSLKPDTVYSFNPVQAEHELRIGNFYFKKGKYRAAVRRFEEAGKWNPAFAEAYLRKAEAEEKLKDREAAKQAYEKYLEISPDAKNASEIKKKVASLH